MSLREDITKCIQAYPNDPDAAARAVCGMLYDINLAEPGNGWFDDDESLGGGDGLDDAWVAWRKIKSAGAPDPMLDALRDMGE